MPCESKFGTLPFAQKRDLHCPFALDFHQPPVCKPIFKMCSLWMCHCGRSSSAETSREDKHPMIEVVYNLLAGRPHNILCFVPVSPHTGHTAPPRCGQLNTSRRESCLKNCSWVTSHAASRASETTPSVRSNVQLQQEWGVAAPSGLAL